MNAKLTARDRMARLLSVIPWVTQHEGAAIDEIERRFDYPRDLLLLDLQEVVFFVGVHPFTPDQLIEVDISDDKVWIRYADWFARPLRLSPEEAAKLLTTARAALQLTDGDDPPDPLTRALTKLGTVLGAQADQAIDVRLGEARAEIIDVIRQAIDRRIRVAIDYYSYGRDEVSHREVDPVRVFSDQGNWYLDAWCHTVGAQRMFRVDRIIGAEAGETPVDESRQAQPASFIAAPGDPRVLLRLDATAKWVTEQYPCESVSHGPDGTLDVRLVVTEIPWLERLLLRLGPAAEITEADPPVSPDLIGAAARRILALYDA